MSKAFTFELVGADKLLKALDKLEDRIVKKIEFRIEDFVKEVNSEQIARCPVGGENDLRGGNDFRKDGPMVWSLFNTMEYAPYVEFGTGAFVKVPTGLEDYAMQFYVNGEGITPATPFFFAPFLTKRKELIEQIKKDLTA
jgi:hypothetical protein